MAVIITALYVLTPRFYEPSAEVWKQWAAARTLQDTGGFPYFSRGPLYILYLQSFLFFDYPLSIQLEYFATHLFCCVSLFLMLRSRLPDMSAMLLACAWIPILAPVEGNAMVMGIGFFALYCRRRKESKIIGPYFPSSLAAAALCHPGYVPFFLGHILGVFIQRLRLKQPLLIYPHSISQVQILPLIVIIVLGVVTLLTVFSPSDSWDHTHLAMDPTYAPIPLNSNPLNIGFFQAGNWKYVTRTMPESTWIYQDWYFTNEKVFGNATTMFQAILNNPKVAIANILENVVPFFQLPPYFFVGNLAYYNGMAGLLWLFVFIGLFALFHHVIVNGLTPHIFSLTLGASTLIGSLFLTSFNPRYMIGLLPLGLLMVSFVSLKLPFLIKTMWAAKSDPSYIQIVKHNPNQYRIFSILGSLFISLGILCNEWTLTTLVSLDGALLPATRSNIWTFDILLILSGAILIVKRNSFSAIVRSRGFSNKPVDPWSTKAIVMICTACILCTVHYPYGRGEQVSAVLSMQGLLSPEKNVSMLSAHQKLLSTVNKQTSVLALEDMWIKAYANVDINQVYDVYRLPPFPDSSGKVEKMLDNLDVIWVSDRWSERRASMATQSHLRYLLHVEPFLAKALGRGWEVQKIKGYGKVYRRMVST